MALCGLKQGLHFASRTSTSSDDTLGSGWSVLSFASGSEASVHSARCPTKIAIYPLPPSLENRITTHDMLLVNFPLKPQELPRESKPQSARRRLSHCSYALKQTFCHCPFSGPILQIKHSCPSKCVTGSHCCLAGDFIWCSARTTSCYPSSPADLYRDWNITDTDESSPGS